MESIELIQELEVMGYFDEEDIEPISTPGPAGWAGQTMIVLII